MYNTHPKTPAPKRQEVDQRFLNQLIQLTTNGIIRWEMSDRPGAAPVTPMYVCQYPFRVSLDPAQPRRLTAVDLELSEALWIWDATQIGLEGTLPNLQMGDTVYANSLQRLRELAASQVEENQNQDYAAVVGGLLRTQ